MSVQFQLYWTILSSFLIVLHSIFPLSNLIRLVSLSLPFSQSILCTYCDVVVNSQLFSARKIMSRTNCPLPKGDVSGRLETRTYLSSAGHKRWLFLLGIAIFCVFRWLRLWGRCHPTQTLRSCLHFARHLLCQVLLQQGILLVDLECKQTSQIIIAFVHTNTTAK